MPKIESVSARKILNSRAEWTVEVTVYLDDNLGAVASIPQGKSRGFNEANFVSADDAVSNVNNILGPAIKDMNPINQEEIDKILIEKDGTDNKAELGANSILGVSLAVARAGALSKGIPLWEHLNSLVSLEKSFPKLFVNVINGGVHAENNVDIQEYMVITETTKPSESVKLAKDFYNNLKIYLKEKFMSDSLGLGDEGGFAPNFNDNYEPFEALKDLINKNNLKENLKIGVDVAASNIEKNREDLFKMNERIIADYGLIYLEDPFGEEKFGDFSLLNKKFGDKVLICGDDLTVTNVFRMKKANDHKSVNSVIIKPNQIGSLSETIKAIEYAKSKNWEVVISHRSGETNDSFISDLAYAVGAYGIKLGSPARGERVSKYNRFLEIESEDSE
jgi:enolase